VRVERRGPAWLLIGGPVPRGFDAITIGRVISVRDGAATSDALLRHELVHVDQYRRMGVVRFLVTYVGSYLGDRLRGYGHLGAYRRIPQEIEAVWLTALANVGDAASPVRTTDTEEPACSPRRTLRPPGATDST
jgi:hypothetical protein